MRIQLNLRRFLNKGRGGGGGGGERVELGHPICVLDDQRVTSDLLEIPERRPLNKKIRDGKQ